MVKEDVSDEGKDPKPDRTSVCRCLSGFATPEKGQGSLQFPERDHDRQARGAPGWEQAAEQSHGDRIHQRLE